MAGRVDTSWEEMTRGWSKWRLEIIEVDKSWVEMTWGWLKEC